MAFLSDTFGSPGIGVTSRTSESGHRWIQHPLYGSAGVITTAGRVRRSGAAGVNGTSMAYSPALPATAEYDVEAPLFVASVPSVIYGGIAGRVDPFADTMYLARYNRTGGRWELVRLASGVAAVLGTFPQTLISAQTYTVKLEIRNAAKKVYIDGVERISSDDNSVTVAGRVGMRPSDNGGSDSTGMHIDAITATDVAGAPPPISVVSTVPKMRDMVGVNVHMSYSGTVYTSGTTKAKLTELGVGYVRDYYVPNRTDQWRLLRELGVGVIMGIGADWIGNAEAAVSGAKVNVPGLIALEGLNEYDAPAGNASTWRQTAREHNDAIRRAVNKDADLAGRVPVIAPSFVNTGSFTTAQDEYLLNSDLGNIHPYPGGAWQTEVHSNTHMAYVRRLTGAQPAWATEWGYHTSTGWHDPGHLPVTETQQRDRLIAGLLSLQGLGWEKVCIYELFDLFSADSQPNRFGLYRNAGTPKPAATALKHWLYWIGDVPEASVPVEFSTTSTMRRRVYQRANGDQFIAFWREADAAATNVTVTFTRNWQMARFRASGGQSFTGWLNSARSYTIPSVGNEPVLLLVRAI